MTEETKELHPAVALLLKRMDSNPQEFLEGAWANAEEAIAAYATDEERKLVGEKLGKLWMDHTYETMLKYLFRVDEKDEVQEPVRVKINQGYAQMHPASGVIMDNQGNQGNHSHAQKKHYLPKITPLERPLRILKGFFKHRA
jgi:hypothetical protein